MRWLKPDTARWSSPASIWGGGAGIYTIRVGTAALGCPGERSSPAPRSERKKPFLTPLLRTPRNRSEEHTSELQSRRDLVCRLLLEKKKNDKIMLLGSRLK